MSIHILGITVSETVRASILDAVHFSLFFVQRALFLCFHFHGNLHFGINIDMLGCGRFVLMVCIVVVRVDFGSSPYSNNGHSKHGKQQQQQQQKSLLICNTVDCEYFVLQIIFCFGKFHCISFSWLVTLAIIVYIKFCIH